MKVLGNVTLTIGYINGVPDRGRQFNLLYDVKSEIWREGRRENGGRRKEGR